MMTKTMRLWRDAEIKSGNAGEFVSLNMAYDVGFGDNKRTVWVSAIWFGKQALGACSHLVKGSQVTVSIRDVEPKVYNDKVSLSALIAELSFVGSKQQPSQSQNPPTSQKKQSSGDDIDSNIPF